MEVNPVLPREAVGAHCQRALVFGRRLLDLFQLVLAVLAILVPRAILVPVVRRAVLLEALQLSQGAVGHVASLLDVAYNLLLDRVPHVNQERARGHRLGRLRIAGRAIQDLFDGDVAFLGQGSQVRSEVGVG